MFSEGVVAPFTFWDVIHMLALSLAFFRCSFVCSLPWFSGLILGTGCIHSGWGLRPRWVLFSASMQAHALVGGSGFRMLSGMCEMHSQYQGELGSQGTILFIGD